jgi:UMF1 family MFS transporter
MGNLNSEHSRDSGSAFSPVTRRELFAWAMYDFANSGYTTVVLTTIFNAYFVSVIAGSRVSPGLSTLLWTSAVGIANTMVLISAPLVGAVADHWAAKKKFLLVVTVGCICSTSLLSLTGPGDIGLAMTLLIFSGVLFYSGENLIAAFLPEIASKKQMGRISGYGWSLGYLGGLLVLAICLVYISWKQGHGYTSAQSVPATMLIVAAAYALATIPTFLWLTERATPFTGARLRDSLPSGFRRLRRTISEAHHFRDLNRFLISLTVYHCGINTVVVLAAVYAQEQMGFTSREIIELIMIVNVTAALGAFLFGRLQDRLGAVPVLAMTLMLWIAAVTGAFFVTSREGFWIIANLVGTAMGSSQSGGRALIGQFSPPLRTAEFFGLWGLAVKLSTVIGPMSYGIINYLTAGNHRFAILSTISFFLIGLLLLLRVDEQRGIAAAGRNSKSDEEDHCIK